MLKENFQLPFGAGNVYYVIKTTETHYPTFVEQHEHDYNDGSTAVHNTIQSALDVCVDSRNDYVIVMPSDADYDLTTALTLSKKSVHLIAAGGMGLSSGASNAVRVHQTGAFPVMVVSDSAIEIAGFYLKPYATKGGIIIADGSYGLLIHHNYFAMNLSGATNEPMLGPYIANTGGTGGAWSTFEYNFFQHQTGVDATIAAIIRFEPPATGCRIQFNDIQIANNSAATVGIENNAVGGIVNYNNLMAAQTATGSGVGVFTHAIKIAVDGVAIGNRAAVAANMFAGGTDEMGFCDNRNGVAGGAAIVDYES